MSDKRKANIVAVSICLFMTGITFPNTATAMSAFAAGIPDDVAKQGVAMGDGRNYSTREAAEAAAMNACRTQKDSPDAVHELCKIIDHFDNRCLAMAIDPKDGTPGWGWGIADTRDAARDQAISTCRASAGADRAPYCVAQQLICDGTADTAPSTQSTPP